MLSSCVVALVLLALTQGMPEAPQPDGVYVAQESTYEMGIPPALHQPDGMAGVPDSELKPQTPPFKQKMSKRRKSNNIDFPNPAQLFPLHPAAAADDKQPTHELGQQDADIESPMPRFVQQRGGPNGPPSRFPSGVRGSRVQFPSPSQLKPFHFGGQHNTRVQHLGGANAFVGQDAPQPQFDQDMDMPEAPMIFPFHFAPRDDTHMQQQQQQQQRQPWMARNPPQPQPYEDQPDMPHWAMQAPPPLHPFPQMDYGDYVAPPMYDDQQPPFGNTIEDEPIPMMDQMPSFEDDESPMPPFQPPFPRFYAPQGRWSRHGRPNWW